MDRKIAKTIVDYIECTTAALDQTEKLAASRDAELQQVRERGPDLVKLLRTHGYIDGSLEKDAADTLMNPVETLELFKRVLSVKQAQRIGTPVGSRQTIVPGSVESPFVGARTSAKKESDTVFERGLGLA